MRPIPPPGWFDSSLHKLCTQFPLPERDTIDGFLVYRFATKSIDAAILLKTARFISGLHAGHILLKNRFFQELGALQRSIGDFGEDATYLALACISKEITDDHKRFLAAFWEEDPDYTDFLGNQSLKNEVPRKKIQSYISRCANGGDLRSNEVATSKYLSRLYSGYVHGAAPHLMDMFNPDTRRFEVDGSKSPGLLAAHEHDFENYFFRGVALLIVVARALGREDVANDALAIHQDLKPYYTK